jgi:hypothetical protein
MAGNSIRESKGKRERGDNFTYSAKPIQVKWTGEEKSEVPGSSIMAESMRGSSRNVETRAHGGNGEGGTLANGSNGHADLHDGVRDSDPIETREWLDALDAVLQTSGEERGQFLLSQLKNKAVRGGVEIPFTANTPYINTIPLSRQPLFPGNRELERRIKSLIRWNAMAMVVHAK